jgi:hypothetical protein
MDEIDHKEDTIINNWMKCEHTSMKINVFGQKGPI